MTYLTGIHQGILRFLITMTYIVTAVGVCGAHGMDTIQLEIHYPVAKYAFIPDFRDNRGIIDSLGMVLKHASPLRIDIVSSSSPEGNAKFNQRLSERRTATALKLLSSVSGMTTDSLTYYSGGADWTGLTPYMEKITRQRKLRRLDGGTAWRHLKDSVFPNLRVSRITIVTRGPLMLLEEEASDYYATAAESPTGHNLLSYVYPDRYEPRGWKPCLSRITGALRSNLLYDIATMPNLGIELAIPHGWSVGLNCIYAWWGGQRHARYLRLQIWELFARRYFGQCELTGWHIGLYAQIGRYDICLNGNGYLSGYSGATFFQRPTLGGGLDAGYAMRLTQKLNLDFTVGVGVLSGQYQTYTATPGHHSVWQSTRQRRYFGPSKAEIALVWLFGKGGEK